MIVRRMRMVMRRISACRLSAGVRCSRSSLIQACSRNSSFVFINDPKFSNTFALGGPEHLSKVYLTESAIKHFGARV